MTQTIPFEQAVYLFAEKHRSRQFGGIAAIIRKNVELDSKESSFFDAQNYDEEPDAWITVNGNHIPLNSSGKAIGGAGGWAKGKDFSGARQSSEGGIARKTSEEGLLYPDKHKMNKQINDIAEASNGGDEESARKVVELIDTLEPGSEITVPDGDSKTVYVKDEYGLWVDKKTKSPWVSSAIAWDFFNDPEYRAYVNKSALSKKELADYREGQRKLVENHELSKQHWTGDKPLEELGGFTVSKDDLKRFGDGSVVIGTDGNQYEYNQYSDVWIDHYTGKRANPKVLVGGKFEGDYYETAFGGNKVSMTTIMELRSTVNALPEPVKKKYENTFRKTPVKESEKDGAYYYPSTHSIYVKADSDQHTIIHEMSHAMDEYAVDLNYEVGSPGSSWTRNIRSASENMTFLAGGIERTNQDFEAMAKAVGYETNGEGWFRSDVGRDYAFDGFMKFAKTHSKKKGFEAVSDAISALTLDKSGGSFWYGGHSQDYWMRRSGYSSMRAQEYWANYCMLRAFHYTDALDLLKQVSPNMYAAAEATYKEAFKDGTANE